MTLQHINIEDLSVSPLNVRKYGAKDCADLVTSIRSLGVLQPLLVREVEDGFEVIAGHLSPLCGFIGLFRYPVSVWADDADLPQPELTAAIQKMNDVGLIAYDPVDSFVQIRGWFLKKNAPENASRMASLAADFSALDAPDELIIHSAAEFAVGSIKRAQRWKPDSPEWQKLRDVFKPFLMTMRQNYEDDFHQALAEQLDGQNRAIKAELCALMSSIQFFLETPRGHRAHTVGAHDTTRHVDDTNTKSNEDENHTAQIRDEIDQPLDQRIVQPGEFAENRRKPQGPFPSTIEAARRMKQICEATTRNGAPCRAKPEPDNKRCRFHGGKSTGPKTDEGKARIAEAQRKRWATWRMQKQYAHAHTHARDGLLQNQHGAINAFLKPA